MALSDAARASHSQQRRASQSEATTDYRIGGSGGLGGNGSGGRGEGGAGGAGVGRGCEGVGMI